MATKFEIDDALEACFGGHEDRDCERCPANPELGEGGKCCFADSQQYDPEDDECQGCIHRDDCPEYMEFEEEEEEEEEVRPVRHTFSAARNRVTTAPRRTTVNRSRVQRTLVTSDMRSRQEIGREDKDRQSAGKTFFKDSIWGAGEGFFKQAYEFFRTHRLR
jgi:hypothetical protein